MDLITFSWLLTNAGQELLLDAGLSDFSDAARLHAVERLRRRATPEQAAAAYETAWLRRRAAIKFPQAARMYFTREALEQASGITIASYRAERYARLGVAQVADLCCGIGGDTLALAGIARVAAVDRDAMRLAMAHANAQALGLAAMIEFHEADLEHSMPPPAAALFFDPARRSAGRRVFTLAEYQPPVRLVWEWRQRTEMVGIKLAPGVSDEEIAPFGPCELEQISVNGDLKEAALWLGPLGLAGKRATVLRESADHAVDVSSLFLPAGELPALAALTEPGAFFYEPDPAVIRSGLVGPLAMLLDAAQIDRSIAYLTADTARATPFARCWRVLEWMPFGLKRIQARLRALDAGPVTVKKRGSPLETDALARKLSGAGSRALVVVLTIVAGRPAALICEGPLAFD
jgi:SAM-dependent methyltransferase